MHITHKYRTYEDFLEDWAECDECDEWNRIDEMHLGRVCDACCEEAEDDQATS